MRDVGWCFFMIPGRQWPFTAGGLLLDSVQGVVRLFMARVALCSLASRAGSILLLLLLVKKNFYLRPFGVWRCSTCMPC